MQLEPVIGLEIHIQLKTKSKMFCSCANIVTGEEAFDGAQAKPNSAICPICLGYPGTLPVPNQQAIAWTQLFGAALDCHLAGRSKFDRKSYFYPDLPKGYQISQYDQPFCGEGALGVTIDGQSHIVGIERIHLEEDAAKNIHPSTGSHSSLSLRAHPSESKPALTPYTLIDFNRAGTPLMELVTKPELASPEQARIFLQELQRISRTLGVSDADMEKGQMRCDANISMREKGSDKLHPKTEVKNINSFKFVAKALAFEIKRQSKLWQEGRAPDRQSTRGFDAAKGTTYEQRTKEEAADYRYFPEPDIPPFEFSDDELKQIKIDVPELPHQKRDRLIRQYNVSQQHAGLLADNSDLADFLEHTASEIEQLDNEQIDIAPADRKPLLKAAVNIITRDIKSIVDEMEDRQELKITPANFAELVVLIYQGKMNRNSMTQVLAEMQRTGGDPDHILKNLDLEQVSDDSDLDAVIDNVIKANPDVVAKIKAGKDSASQYLMGQVMKQTQGKANAAAVLKILREKLQDQ